MKTVPIIMTNNYFLYIIFLILFLYSNITLSQCRCRKVEKEYTRVYNKFQSDSLLVKVYYYDKKAYKKAVKSLKKELSVDAKEKVVFSNEIRCLLTEIYSNEYIENKGLFSVIKSSDLILWYDNINKNCLKNEVLKPSEKVISRYEEYIKLKYNISY